MNIRIPYFLLGPSALLTLWFLFGLGGYAGPLVPRIEEVFARLFSIGISSAFVLDVSATLWRAVSGFFLASILGVPLGLMFGSYPRLYQSFNSTVDFFRSLPATAMFPLFLLFFGIGDASKIAIAWFISFWVIIVNATYGAINSSKTRLKVARSLHASGWQTFVHITLMESLPQIFIGLRTALSLSLIAVVVSEMFIGSSTGLGQRVYDAYLTYDIPGLYAWLIVTGITGYALNKTFVVFERKTLHWVGR